MTPTCSAGTIVKTLPVNAEPIHCPTFAMTVFNFVPRLLVARLLTFGLGAAACTAPVLAQTTLLPFRASLATQETLGYDPVRCPVGGIVGTTTGVGQASQLGSVKMLSTDCPLLAPGVLPTFSNGMLTFTASNGDLLTASYQGALHPVGGVPDLYTVAGDFSVTGGTGRFVGAKGSGYLQGTITLGQLVSKGEYQVTGYVSY